MRAHIFSVALGACAATTPTTANPTGGPRGLRASEHLDVAHQQQESASAAEGHWFERINPGPERSDPLMSPTLTHQVDPSVDHSRAADVHLSEAAVLDAEYDRACAGRNETDITVSPLVRYGTGGWMTKTGAVVYLTPAAGTPDALLASLACHRAWMMLAPTNMDDCPLDLPGLVVDAHGEPDGVTLSLGVKDPKLIPELQRRVSLELESRPSRGAHAMRAP